MAGRPPFKLTFLEDGCPDCGERRAVLPGVPVPVPDEFDWTARDFEGFRRIMLEDLAAADPERQRWTEGDMEVVLVDVLAAALDRASHALDSVFAEHMPQTARRPQSLIALLKMVDGIRPAASAVTRFLTARERDELGLTVGGSPDADTLLAILERRPALMEAARTAGLSALGSVQSLLTLEDLGDFLAACPSVVQVRTRHVMEAGQSYYEGIILLRASDKRLSDTVSAVDGSRGDFARFFMDQRDRSVSGEASEHPMMRLDHDSVGRLSIRVALSRLIEPLLPVGVRLRLIDGKRVGLFLRLCIEVSENYFRSEVELAVRQILGNAPGQFFDPARFRFGERLMLSDLSEAFSKIDGVRGVIFNRARIVGRPQSEGVSTGEIVPRRGEALTMDLSSPGADTGYLYMTMTGGRLG